MRRTNLSCIVGLLLTLAAPAGLLAQEVAETPEATAVPEARSSVTTHEVTIGGERTIEYPSDGSTSLHRRERQAGVFRRAFNLPEPADPEKTEAICRHGILMVRIPKAESQKPRRISVRGS